MIKFTSNNDFDFHIESVQLLRDSGSQLTKRASAKELLKYSKTKDQEDLHLIALGAYEGTGYNRNGDAFTEADCRKNHTYFSRANRAVHRHHKNKPADPKFGNIKAAAYNEPMKRIELIVGLDRDKCADILDEQEKTGNTNWSMASKQAYDICSWCGHKAKTDKDRCEHIPSHLGEINKTGEMCGMVNPDPRWFEISYVRRPADRIGMSLGKMASDSAIKPMLPKDYLQIYGDIYVPDDLYISKKASDKRDLIKKLAELEKHVEGISQGHASNSRDQFIHQHAAKLNASPGVQPDVMDHLRQMEPSQVLKTLADQGIIFKPEDFAKYLFDNRVSDQHVQGAKTHLPHMYSNLEESNDTEVANNEKFEPSSDGSRAPAELKNTAHKMHGEHSLFGKPAMHRQMLAHGDHQLHPHNSHMQSKVGFDKAFAKQYAAYKLAALNYLDEQGKLDDDIMLNAVIQNRG